MTNRTSPPARSSHQATPSPSSADLQLALQKRLRGQLGSPTGAGFSVPTSGQDHGYPQDWDLAAPKIFGER